MGKIFKISFTWKNFGWESKYLNYWANREKNHCAKPVNKLNVIAETDRDRAFWNDLFKFPWVLHENRASLCSYNIPFIPKQRLYITTTSFTLLTNVTSLTIWACVWFSSTSFFYPYRNVVRLQFLSLNIAAIASCYTSITSINYKFMNLRLSSTSCCSEIAGRVLDYEGRAHCCTFTRFLPISTSTQISCATTAHPEVGWDFFQLNVSSSSSRCPFHSVSTTINICKTQWRNATSVVL